MSSVTAAFAALWAMTCHLAEALSLTVLPRAYLSDGNRAEQGLAMHNMAESGVRFCLPNEGSPSTGLNHGDSLSDASQTITPIPGEEAHQDEGTIQRKDQ